MAGGFYSGVAWGAVASVAIVGAASLLGDIPGDFPGAQQPTPATLEVPDDAASGMARGDTSVRVPDGNIERPAQAGALAEAAANSRIEAPAPDDQPTLPEAQNPAMPTKPQTGAIVAEMTAPQAVTAPHIATVQDTPVAPNRPTAVPQISPELAADSEALPARPAPPAQIAAPQMPDVGSIEGGFSGADAPEATPIVPTGQMAKPMVENAPGQPQQLGQETLDMASASMPAVTPTLGQAQGLANAMSDEPRVTVPVVAAIGSGQPGVGAPSALGAAPAGEAAPVIATKPPVALVPALVPVSKPEPDIEIAAVRKPFQNLAPNVATNRLPSLRAPAPTATTTATTTEDAADVMAEDLPPVARYASPFENLDNKPLMAIVLIDDGNSPIGLDALAAFPYPLSFAVDTAWAGAPGAMQTYRAAGFEVLALVDLPLEATAQDAETNLAIKLGTIPEAVAVMEGATSGFQGNRAVSDQVTAIVAASGHGLLLFPKGLNTAQKLARKAGVPAAAVFRDFDAQGQDAKTIRRFLDHAAFKAAQQEGGVVMVGRLRADTISALLLWGLQDRASRVALAPVSAVLTKP